VVLLRTENPEQQDHATDYQVFHEHPIEFYIPKGTALNRL